MSFAATISAAILDTILGRLALLFLTAANGDLPSARHAAAQMLGAYDAVTENELRLAAEVIGFSFHALEALGQAASPELSSSHKLRLRGSAVSLSRASHKAQHRLDLLQKARRTGPPAAAETTDRTAAAGASEPTAAAGAAESTAAAGAAESTTAAEATERTAAQPQPKIDKALDLITDTRDAMAQAKTTGQTWTQAFQQRQRAKRIAEKLKKQQPAQIGPVSQPLSPQARPTIPLPYVAQ